MEFFPITASRAPKAPLSALQNEGTQNQTGTEPDTVIAPTPSEQAEEFDTFLQLLTAQIRNQDPLAPLDSTQFVEQLATFSNLELQAEGNQILSGIAALLESQLTTNGTTTPAPAPVTDTQTDVPKTDIDPTPGTVVPGNAA